MLTAYQAETAAYIADGGFYHPSCAAEKYGELAVNKAGIGIDNAYDLSALSRYSLYEYTGERTYEDAEERLEGFISNHPTISAALGLEHDRWADPNTPEGRAYGRRWRLLDRLADKFPFELPCDYCGEAIE